MLKKQLYLALCLLSGITLNIYAQDNQEVPTEQQRSVISRTISNTYDAIEADILSVIALIKNNPVKTFIAAAAFVIIIGSVEGVVWRAQYSTFSDIRREIGFALDELRKLNDNQKSDIQKILDKLQACYKRS